MKNLIILILLFAIFSCEESKPKFESIDAEDLTAVQIDSILTKFKFQYEAPIVVDSTNYVLVPISTELLERRTKYSKGGYYSDDFPRYWNVLFYNRETGENQLLSEEKIRISRIHVNSNEDEKGSRLVNKKILYEIADIDFNKDKMLNSKDPEYLFSSEINGSNLKRVSPINEDLQYFKVISSPQQILIKTLRDVNQDSLFNREDESVWYKAEMIDAEWKLKEIINSEGRKRIENLYFEQWLKKK